MRYFDHRLLNVVTREAYSVDRYRTWPAICKAMGKFGYTYEEAQVVLCSKWMRWAGDHIGKNRGITVTEFTNAAILMDHFPLPGTEELRHLMVVVE